jgi:hypothetical protein
MKLAWICYEYDNGDEMVNIVFIEPDRYRWHKVVPIVYAEIVENDR